MKVVNKIWNRFVKWLPYVWSFSMVTIITGGLLGVLIIVIKWILSLLGVI